MFSFLRSNCQTDDDVLNAKFNNQSTMGDIVSAGEYQLKITLYLVIKGDIRRWVEPKVPCHFHPNHVAAFAHDFKRVICYIFVKHQIMFLGGELGCHDCSLLSDSLSDFLKPQGWHLKRQWKQLCNCGIGVAL